MQSAANFDHFPSTHMTGALGAVFLHDGALLLCLQQKPADKPSALQASLS